MNVPVWVPIVVALLGVTSAVLLHTQHLRTTKGEIGTSAAADVWKAAESQLVSYQVELKESREEQRLTRAELKETRAELKESRDEGLLTREKLAEVVGGQTLMRGELQTLSDKLTLTTEQLGVSNALVTDLQEQLRGRANG